MKTETAKWRAVKYPDVKTWSVVGAESIASKIKSERDATLLAAAPALLEALERLVDQGECFCADYVATNEPCGHCQARAAIAAATIPR